MNEMAKELLKRADTIGAWLSGKATTVADAAMQQAIDIAQQYVLFGRAYNTFVILGLLLLLFVCYKATRIFWETTDGFVIVFTGITSMFSLAALVFNFKEFFMVWFAPKIWLMIQLTEIAKGATK